MYLPGDTVLITDIGVSPGPADPGSSLVCVTTNVNTQCCRNSDGGSVGEWYFPGGNIVPCNGAQPTADFTRSGHTQQVRLNRRNNAMNPTGVFECRVPDGNDSSMLVTASVTLTTGQWTY